VKRFAWIPLALLAGCAPAHRAVETSAPPPRLIAASDKVERQRFGLEVRHTLLQGRFDDLEALADSLDAGDVRFVDGVPELYAYFRWGFQDMPQHFTAAQWEQLLSRLREWQDVKPDSRWAPVALANGLIGRGWAARGGGYASTVKRSGWHGFEGDLQDAGSILRQSATRSKPTAQWYDAMLDVLHGQADDEFDAVYRQATARYPDYARFYLTMSWHLQPRWYGQPGDWEKFAAHCAPALPDSIQAEIYARIVTYQSGYTENVFKESQGLSWARVQLGLDVWQRRFPAQIETASLRARFAADAKDQPVARAAFQALGDTVDVDFWRTRQEFLAARDWALGGPAVAAARP